MRSEKWKSRKLITKKSIEDFSKVKCFQDQTKIIGGHNAEPNEWPFIAVLFNGGRQFCGGSLIDDIHILTAAHCVAQ